MSAQKLTLCFLLLVFMFKPSSSFIVNSSKSPLKVASFNIRHFGRGLMSDHTVANRIAQICERYDVVFIMETRDSSGTALNDLWTLLNKTDDWGLVQSNPLGRSNTYKEQYVFFYRTEKAKVMSSYQVPDSHDVYEREPFCVEFQFWSVSHGEKRRVVLMGLHSRPDDVKEELGKLPDTIKSVDRHFHSADGVISMGDFNADCSYASGHTRDSLEIFDSSSDFTSLIPSSADTTVSNSNCAYDRIIVYGSQVSARSAKVYNYQSAMHLSYDDAYDISDHFPVEFQLY